MENNVGVWLDHQKAIVVALRGAEEQRALLSSDVDRHTRLHGGGRSSNPFGGFDAPSETRADRRRDNQIKSWCREVMDALSNADRIYLFGPGEAKRDLVREMEKSKTLSQKIVGLDSADQMTENQVAAQVRDFFQNGKRKVPEYRKPPGT